MNEQVAVSGYWIFEPAIPTPYPLKVLSEVGPVSLERVGNRDGFHVDVWAIRCGGRCWGRSGDWDLEPIPSSRTDEWLAEYRWTLAEAAAELGFEVPEQKANALVEAAKGCLPENDDLQDLGFREVPGSRLRALAEALANWGES